MSDIEDSINDIENLWKKTPLENMYDVWHGTDKWEEGEPPQRYKVYSWDDIKWRGMTIMAGQPFPCHLCGETDRWMLEHDNAPVFICEHEPISVGRSAIRQISSVSKRLIGQVEEV